MTTPGSSASPLNWADRFRAAMLGGAVGDAFGAAVRNSSTADVQRWYGPRGLTDYAPAFGRRGQASDLTQLSAFTLEAVLRTRANAGADGQVLSYVFRNQLRWLHTQGVPWPFAMRRYLHEEPAPTGWLLGRPELYSTRNPGGPALAALGGMAQQSPVDARGGVRPASAAEGPVDCLVWTAPLAVCAARPDTAFELASALANVFTSASNTRAAAGTHGCVLARVLRGSSLWEAVAQADEQLAVTSVGEETGRFPAAVRQLLHGAMFVSRRERPVGPGELDVEFDLASGFGELGVALTAVGRTPSFADAVRAAVNHSADSAVAGSLAGQLAGALYGPAAIPAGWLDELELREVLETLSQDAVDAFGVPRWARRYAEQQTPVLAHQPGGPERSERADRTMVLPAIPASDEADEPGAAEGSTEPLPVAAVRTSAAETGVSGGAGALGAGAVTWEFAGGGADTGPDTAFESGSAFGPDTAFSAPHRGRGGTEDPPTAVFPAAEAAPLPARDVADTSARSEEPAAAEPAVEAPAWETPPREEGAQGGAGSSLGSTAEEARSEPGAAPAAEQLAPEAETGADAARGAEERETPSGAPEAEVSRSGAAGLGPDPEPEPADGPRHAEVRGWSWQDWRHESFHDTAAAGGPRDSAFSAAEHAVREFWLRSAESQRDTPVEEGPVEGSVEAPAGNGSAADTGSAVQEGTSAGPAHEPLERPGAASAAEESLAERWERSAEAAPPAAEGARGRHESAGPAPVHAVPEGQQGAARAAEAGRAEAGRGGEHARGGAPVADAPSLAERVLGGFLGSALGDACGYGPADAPAGFGAAGAASVTEVTRSTLFTAEGLIRASVARRALGESDPLPELRLAHQRWLHACGVEWSVAAGPFREAVPQPDGWLVDVTGMHVDGGASGTVLEALIGFGAGGTGTPDNRADDAGAVPRGAPIALLSADPAEVFDLAARTAAFTHAHPDGHLPAGAFAVVVQQGLLGRELDDGVWLALQVLETCEDSALTSGLLRSAVELARADIPAEEVRERLGAGSTGAEALAIAVYAALTGGADVAHAAVRAARHSGEPCVVGALCGCILGALRGVGRLPVDSLAGLELRAVVQRMALDCVAEFADDEAAVEDGAVEGETSTTRPDDEEWHERYPVRALGSEAATGGAPLGAAGGAPLEEGATGWPAEFGAPLPAPAEPPIPESASAPEGAAPVSEPAHVRAAWEGGSERADCEDSSEEGCAEVAAEDVAEELDPVAETSPEPPAVEFDAPDDDVPTADSASARFREEPGPRAEPGPRVVLPDEPPLGADEVAEGDSAADEQAELPHRVGPVDTAPPAEGPEPPAGGPDGAAAEAPDGGAPEPAGVEEDAGEVAGVELADEFPAGAAGPAATSPSGAEVFSSGASDASRARAEDAEDGARHARAEVAEAGTPQVEASQAAEFSWEVGTSEEAAEGRSTAAVWVEPRAAAEAPQARSGAHEVDPAPEAGFPGTGLQAPRLPDDGAREVEVDSGPDGTAGAEGTAESVGTAGAEADAGGDRADPLPVRSSAMSLDRAFPGADGEAGSVREHEQFRSAGSPAEPAGPLTGTTGSPTGLADPAAGAADPLAGTAGAGDVSDRTERLHVGAGLPAGGGRSADGTSGAGADAEEHATGSDGARAPEDAARTGEQFPTPKPAPRRINGVVDTTPPAPEGAQEPEGSPEPEASSAPEE